MLCKVPIFFIHRLGVADRDEKSGGCHLKKLVMTSLPKNQWRHLNKLYITGWHFSK
jgi:hypothetical protein